MDFTVIYSKIYSSLIRKRNLVPRDTTNAVSIHILRYSPFRALASLIRRLHSSLFSAFLLRPLIPSSCNASFWTTSAHLLLGLPTGLWCGRFRLKPFLESFLHLVSCNAVIAVLRTWIMFEHSMYIKSVPFPCSQFFVYLLNPSEASMTFPERIFFSPMWGCPHDQPPNLEDQGVPFCLGHHLWPVRLGWPCQ